MYRQLLTNYVTRSEQLNIDKENPVGLKWCNFLCQQSLPVENFYKTTAGKNMCIKCSRKLVVTKKYIKSGKITKEQFKDNPNIIEEYQKKHDENKIIECVECKEDKKLSDFDHNRNICKKCRKRQTQERVEKRIENDIEQLENYKTNISKLSDFIKNLPVNIVQKIMKRYNICRMSTDKKADMVAKVIDHFKKLQDPYKCLGHCGFTLTEQFSYCKQCEINPKITVEENNHSFKEHLPVFMEGVSEISEELMYKLNSFCIRAIAEHLGIEVFKTKKKGDTKEKMVKIINEHMKKNENKKSHESPNLELNGVLILCRDDGYINAAKLCEAGGKRFNNWWQNSTTKELVNALFLNTGIPVIRLVDIKKGRYGGSWIHPDLAIQLAQWISPIFSLQVSRWVRELALTGSVYLREEKSSEELLELQKNYRKLKTNHNILLEKRQYHKFKKGASYYIISDTESGCIKFKPGFEGVDINVRLAQHRSTLPSIRVEFLVYGSISDCKLLESVVLKRYKSKRTHSNHEWIYGIDKEHIIRDTKTMMKFLGMEYTEEEVTKYNREEMSVK